MSYQVNWEMHALDLPAGFLSTIQSESPPLESVSQLSDEPRPSDSFPYGSPDLRRLRAGRYRVFYKIDEGRQVVEIDHVRRLP